MERPNKIGYIIAESPTVAEDSRIISQKSNRVIAEGTLQDLYTENRNRRTYDNEIKEQIKCARTKELLETGNMKGENGHPMNKELARQSTIDPDMVCVKYLKFWTDGNKIKAQFKGTNNQRGEDFNSDLLDGEKPSFSLRALGSIETASGKACVKNVKLITYDRVIYPSHKCAYTDKIINNLDESTNMASSRFQDDGINSYLIPITNESVVNYIKTESANIKTIRDNFDILYESILPVVENGTNYVQLTDSFGNIFRVRLENYIKNEIMNYCSKL